MSDFYFRPYQPEDTPILYRAFQEVFNTYRSPDEWQAIYQNNPHHSHIMLAFSHRDELAACYACTAHEAILQGETVSVGHIRDVFSVPAFRPYAKGRRGLFAQVYDTFIQTWLNPQHLIFLYGFPSLRHAKLGTLLMDYQAFSNWQAYALDLSSALSPHSPQVEVEESKAFSNEFTALWQQRQAQFPFAIKRDAEFLQWRFAQTNKYQVWTCREYLADSILGYVVLMVENKTVYLLDFCWPDNPSALQNFWLQLCSRLYTSGFRCIETWCTSSYPMLHKQLTSIGFHPMVARKDVRPVYRCFHPDESTAAWVDEHFYFNMADSDLY